MTRLRREDGFTVIEFLVAAIVLVIGIGATIAVLNGSGRAGANAERHQRGIALAQEEIEKVRGLSYEQVGMNSTTYPVLGGVSDRVSGGRLTPIAGAPSTTEPLVGGADCAAAGCAVTPYSTVTIGSGSSATTAKVYRFVAWRNEECGLLGSGAFGLLSGLTGANGAGSLATLISTLSATTGSGSLGSLLTSISSSNSNLTGLINSLGGLLGALLPTLNSVVGHGSALSGIANQLDAVLTPLAASGGLVSALTSIGNLTQLDLCDMDLKAIRELKTLGTALQGSNPAANGGAGNGLSNALGQLQAAIPPVVAQFNNASNVHCSGLVGCILSGLLNSVLTPVNNALNSLRPPLVTQINGLLSGTSLADLLDDLEDLQTTLPAAVAGLTNDTVKNTKRVQIAVVLDPAGDVGPLKPIWMSTVVTDPDAGLLSG